MEIQEEIDNIIQELEREGEIENRLKSIFKNCEENLITPLIQYVVENIEFDEQKKTVIKIIQILHQMVIVIKSEEKPLEHIYSVFKKLKEKNEAKNIENIEEIIEKLEQKLLPSLEKLIPKLCDGPHPELKDEIQISEEMIIEYLEKIIKDTEFLEEDIETKRENAT